MMDEPILAVGRRTELALRAPGCPRLTRRKVGPLQSPQR